MDQKIICDAEDLTAIADAVRISTGSTNTYNVPELSTAAVNAIGTRVNIDETLTISGAAADAKVTGDRIAGLSEEMVKSVTQAIAPIQEDVGNLESGKVSLPVTNSTPNYGTAGQFAISDGNGGITWKTLVEAEGVDY